MKKWLGLTLAALGSLSVLASTAAAQSAKMPSSVIGSGGTRASGGTGTGYTLNATVGQTIIGPVNDAPTNAKWDLQGFWYVAYRYQFDTTSGVLADRGYSDISAGSAVLYNAPNPFSDWTNVRVILTKPDHVTLKLFNSLGQEVSTLLDENHEAGPINVRLSAHDLESGQYQIQLITSDIHKMITVVVVK
jgi:hypothetical protein